MANHEIDEATMSKDIPPPKRLVPHRDLPPYSYVPGMHPHPIREEDGHSFGVEVAVSEFDPNRWRECEEYLFGIDLFNAGFYWEAHEAWEAVWICVGRTGQTADFLKGLIKLAAAGVKAREGNGNGVERHAARAAQLFGESCAGEEAMLGLELDSLLDFSRQLRRDRDTVLDLKEAPVRRVWGFVLALTE